MAEPRRTPSTPATPQRSNRLGKAPMGIKKEETSDRSLQEGVFPTNDIHPDPLQEYYVVWRTRQTDLTSASSQFSAELLGMFKDRDTANGYVKASHYPHFDLVNASWSAMRGRRKIGPYARRNDHLAIKRMGNIIGEGKVVFVAALSQTHY
ncbi:MAG: hypothetical protein Q9226_005451 [Calogaya cf. arnoldii]